jgi:hypothetical protein
MRLARWAIVCLLLTGCAVSYTIKTDGEKEYSWRVMQMAYLKDHGSAQSTVGLGFSLRFTDHSGAVTPKLDLGYFRHATGLTPVLTSSKSLGDIAIVTSADVTGSGIQDEVDFGEASLVHHFQENDKPSMFELVIGELTTMKESANAIEKQRLQNNIDFLNTVLGGMK